MSWELLALFAALCYGAGNLVQKHIMKTENTIVYAWFFNVFSAAFFFLLFVREASFPPSYIAWLIVLLASSLYVLANVTGLEAYKHTDISVRDPLSKTSVLFTLIFSMLILKESLTINKFLGVFLLLIGAVILAWHKDPLKRISKKGIILTLINAFLMGLVAVIDKTGLAYFTPAFYGFLVFLFPTMILTPAALGRADRVKASFHKMKMPMIAVSLLAAAGYFSQITAYNLTDVSNVAIVVQMSIVISVLGGYLFHKEGDLIRRLIGALFIIAGTALVIRPFF
ncbi:MAG: EamA family transporter [Candidatus Aenigmarchaeota archaeon]|nr:EamA family transporter [Candidatus Aenigmarchaeota archaeon]